MPRAGVVVCGVALLASACAPSRSSGPVEVTLPDLEGRARALCTALVGDLPDTVAGAPRRDVRPQDAAAAAWGDPAIVLTCGVGDPRGFDEFATCQEVEGIGWWVPDEQVTGSPVPVTMTTIDREVNIEVRLPEEYWPPADAMVDLAPAVDGVPQTDPCV